MKLDIQSFRGEAPRLTPRMLPDTAAQSATNSRMETGDLMPWRQFVSEKVLAAAATTIYKLNGSWLSWAAQVDVARGLIPGDTSFFTFLTAPSLYTEPRYTTYTLATTGAEPYPVTTRPLGMPAPTVAPTLVAGVDTTPTTTSVNATDAGDVLATEWTVNPPLIGSTYATVTQGAGVYTILYDENNNPGQEAYAYKSFGIANLSAVNVRQKFTFGGDTSHMQATIHVAASAPTGAGIRVRYQDGLLVIGKATTWGAIYSVANLSITALTALVGAVEYTFDVTATTNDDGTKTVTAKIFNGVTELISATVTNTFDDGDLVGIACGINDDSGSQYRTDYSETVVTGSGPNGFVAINTATSYVYTFVGYNDWESAQSPASATILRPDGVSVTVTTATTHAFSAGYGIDTKRIYRSVSGATGDIYLLVAEIALATATYVDTLDDSTISTPGTPLESEGWDLPNALMQGIRALPNGFMVGFFANQLCFSAVGHPHAWPVKYRLTANSDIVAIDNLDNTIVVLTKARVQTATGNDPASYSMSEPGEAQACVSKLGVSYVDGFGVCFPSPDGYQVCAGSAGNVKNATSTIFTKPQWEALTPSSIRSAVYDGILFFWFTGSTPDAGYALDTKPDGFGLISLAHHAAAAYVDPLTDSLFVILDVNSEPVEAALPVASTAVTPTTTTIFQFDAHATNKVRYLWRGKLNLLPHDTTMHFAKVEAEDFVNLVLRVYGDGVLIQTKQITSAAAFRVPATTCYNTYEVTLVGTSRARTVQLAQSIEELT